MKKVVYYARVSTEEEKQLNALDNQIKMLEDFINGQLEWQLVDKYIDEGISGTTTKNRKEYNRLYEDLLTDKFDIIVIKDQSRLNRNVLDYYQFVDRMVKNEKQLFYYSDNQFYKPDDTLVNGIKALLSAEYSRDISKKVKAGITQKQKQGVVFGNATIWGYDKDINGNFIINENEANIIRRIFNWYVEGKGFRSIFKMLDNEGIKNRNGKPFAMTTLKRIIRNEKYKGVVVANKRQKNFDTKKVTLNDESQWIVHENAIPAIVSEELWNTANEILSTKKRKRNDEGRDKEEIAGYFKGNHLYSNKIFCGDCGATYWHVTYRKKSLYMCQEYKKFGLKDETGRGCVNYKLHEDDLNNIMKEIIFKVWEQKEDINTLFSILERNLEDNNNEEFDQLTKKKTKLENRKSNLIDMKADGEITKEEYLFKKNSIDEELEKINTRLVEIEEKNKSNRNRVDRIKDMKDFITNNVVKDKDLITEKTISQFLNKIIVKSETELEIILNGNLKFNAVKQLNQFTISQSVSDTI